MNGNPTKFRSLWLKIRDGTVVLRTVVSAGSCRTLPSICLPLPHLMEAHEAVEGR